VALVTGAGSGMGRSHARALAGAGVSVVVSDINFTAAKETAMVIERDFDVTCVAYGTDVSSEASVAELFNLVHERFGRLDFLVNNAATLLNLPKPFKPFWEIPYSEWLDMMAVNVGGVFLCCRGAFPLMSSRKFGRIINVTSDAIYKGYEDQLHYFASKGAVAVMTRNLAREFGPFGVTVNAIAPGYTKTESAAASPEMQRVEPLILRSQCINIVQMPEDVSQSVLFLCGEGARTITGQSLVVNCGAIMP
jgi:3-oxoacyl-[acyl-carrier protein] reductase